MIFADPAIAARLYTLPLTIAQVDAACAAYRTLVALGAHPRRGSCLTPVHGPVVGSRAV